MKRCRASQPKASAHDESEIFPFPASDLIGEDEDTLEVSSDTSSGNERHAKKPRLSPALTHLWDMR